MLQNNGKQGTHYASHDTIFILINKFLNNLNNIIVSDVDNNEHDNIINNEQDDNILLNASNLNNPETAKTQNILEQDYSCRSDIHENVCLYVFACNYQRVRINKLKNNLKKGKKPEIKYNFTSDHQYLKSSQYIKRKNPVVPIIIGPPFPSMHDLDNHDLYTKLIMILFKLWRTLHDLYNTENKSIHKFDNFYKNLNTNSVESNYINNIEYLKRSADEAALERDIKNKNTNIDFNQDNMDIDPVYEDDINNDNNLILNFITNNDDTSNPALWKHNLNEILQKLNKNSYECSNTGSNLSNFTTTPTNNTLALITTPSNNTLALIKKWKKQLQQQNITTSILNEMASTYANECTQNLIEFISDTSHTIEYILKEYNLNTKQSIAFLNFTLPTKEICEQILIFVTGEGGTGKSQIIKAISTYFTRNNMNHKLIKGAPTGCAAYLIDGN
jgi:hypothetical protein